MKLHEELGLETGISDLPSELLVELYRKMLLIRKHEELCQELKAEGLAKGPLHLCIGQEAVGVGVGAALRQEDVITSTHRGHAHFLGKGADPGRLLAEILGRRSGYGKGKGGHMLICDAEMGVMAGSGIVGGMLTVAVGEALAFQVKGQDRVAVCFFGEGAATEGAFNEALNLAGLWNLPVVFVCENNLYGLTVPVAEQLSVESVVIRASGFGLPTVSVDGNDVVAVYLEAQKAVARARSGQGPSLIEAHTYRIVGFSTGDSGGYRTEEEIAAWEARDPIRHFEARLKGQGLLEDQTLAMVQDRVESEIEVARSFAMESPFPEPSEVLEDLWA